MTMVATTDREAPVSVASVRSLHSSRAHARYTKGVRQDTFWQLSCIHLFFPDARAGGRHCRLSWVGARSSSTV